MFASVPVLAQEAQSSAEPVQEQPVKKRSLVYVEPSMANLSQLYWALGKMDIENNSHVDNYLLINECELYQDYIFDDIACAELRELTRSSIVSTKRKFPVRFSFSQRIKLGDYDVERQKFNVVEDSKIEVAQRFVLDSTDAHKGVCGKDYSIPSYPNGIVLEFSRPFIFLDVPMGKETAAAYLQERSAYLKSLGDTISKEKIYNSRSAYLVLNVKMLSYKGEKYLSGRGQLANILGVLEEYEVYADKDLTQKLYSKSFRRSRKGPKKKTAYKAADSAP